MDPEEIVTETELTPAGGDVTPEVTETPVADPTETPAPTPEDEIAELEALLRAATTPEEKTAVQGKINRRFGTITRQKYEAEAREAYWRGIAEANAKATQSQGPMEVKPPETPVLTLPPKPKKSDFKDDEGYENEDAYIEAMATWGGEVALTKAKHQTSLEQAQKNQEAQKTQQQTEAQKHWQWVQQAEQKYPDFRSVFLKDSLPISMPVYQEIRASEQGPEIAYYLGKNPREASRLFDLPPNAVAKEIGKLEVKLAQAPPAKKVTAAPTPITPVGAPGETSVDPLKMSPDEWQKWEIARCLKEKGRPY